MRNFRRLPPFLRVVGILALLFSLAALFIIATQVVVFILGGDVVRQEIVNDHRAFATAMNLTMLSLACGFAVNRYRTRLRQLNQERFAPDSWPRQARTTALLAALPLCAIALAAIFPLTQVAAVVTVFLISVIGAVVLITVYARLVARG